MIERQDMHVYVDNLTYDNNTVNHNLSDIINYIIQYRFQGGPEQPIRYLEMKVNKNDIDSANPELMHSIVEGKTRLLVDAVDGGTFIITKIWLKDNEYDIVATGIEVTLNTATLTSIMAQAVANLDPPKIIETIFNDWVGTLDLTNDDGFRLYLSDSVSLTRTSPGYKIGFKENMPTLVAMNMCALLDDAFIFFANKDWTENGVTKKYNTMFYVRYSDIKPLAYNPGDDSQNGVVNIYPRLDSQYVDYTRFDLLMFKRLIGLSSKSSEGSETIVNNQIVSMEGGRGEAHNTYSERMYGDYAGTAVMSDLMISYDVTIEGVATSTAQIIAENLVRRYKDPTRSITIELTEINNTDTGSGWEGIIEPFSYAYKINDNVNNIALTNIHLCDGDPDDFMLRLSTFVRAYPEMTTEYTFGVMKETTLSQELANKLTGMSGTIADIRYMGTSVANNGVVTIDQVPTDGSHNPVSSDGTYDAIQSAIQGVAPQGTIGTDTKPLKLLNGTLVPVTDDLVNVNNAQTITGDKTFEPSTSGAVTIVGVGNANNKRPILRAKMTGVPASSNPSTAIWGGLQFTNTGDAEVGSVTFNRATNGDSNIHLYVKNVGGATSSLKVIKDNAGNGYVTAPNRTYDTNNTSDVVTIGLLKSSSDVVHTSGNETIAGTKTFSSTITGNISGNSGTANALTSGNKTIDGDLIITNNHTIKFGTSGDGISHNSSPQYFICTTGGTTSEGVSWCSASEIPTKSWSPVFTNKSISNTGDTIYADISSVVSTIPSTAKEVMIMAMTSQYSSEGSRGVTVVPYASGLSKKVRVLTDDGTSTSYCVDVIVYNNRVNLSNVWHACVTDIYYR